MYYYMGTYFHIGRKGSRWAGLSFPLEGVKKTNTVYGWLNSKEMGIKQVKCETVMGSTDTGFCPGILRGAYKFGRLITHVHIFSSTNPILYC